LYPHLGELIRHVHAAGLSVEVFSNLTYVREELWRTFTDCGVKLATSYYSDTPEDHDKVTNLRGSHRRTRANIERALNLRIPLRGGVVTVRPGQRAREAAQDLLSLGVEEVGGDRTRAFGRGSRGAAPTIADLCGHCAHEKCAIGPNGDVWPCVLGRFLTMNRKSADGARNSTCSRGLRRSRLPRTTSSSNPPRARRARHMSPDPCTNGVSVSFGLSAP
jgi:hypothetical protein